MVGKTNRKAGASRAKPVRAKSRAKSTSKSWKDPKVRRARIRGMRRAWAQRKAAKNSPAERRGRAFKSRAPA